MVEQDSPGPRYVVYAGGYLDEEIVAERNLPTRNPAGSNRMSRIGAAFSAGGKKAIILSPGISMRVGFQSRFVHPERHRHSDGFSVVFSRAVSAPLIGALSSFIFLPLLLWKLQSERNVDAVVIYNFSPLLLLVAFLARYLWRLPVLHNVEDISEPRFDDWRLNSEARPVQQLVFYFCMSWIGRMAQGAICPTARFIPFLRNGLPVEVITGCIDVPLIQIDSTPSVTQTAILFAGKIENEHGIDVFVRAVKILTEKNILSEGIRVDICGGGRQSRWVESNLSEIGSPTVNYHGFVSDSEYNDLLNRATVCVALQQPEGRYGSFKTPSKVYEYLGNGKAVVATDVGDLANLPEHVIRICSDASSAALAEVLQGYIENPKKSYEQGVAARMYSLQHFATDKVGARLIGFLNSTTSGFR